MRQQHLLLQLEGAQASRRDAVFGPVFRYVDVFDRIGDFGVIDPDSRVARWQLALCERPSIVAAAPADYEDRLWTFLQNRQSYLSRLMV